jgi:integrase
MAKKQTCIVERHARARASRSGRACNCHPVYEAWVWSARDQKRIYRSFKTVTEAKSWRRDAGGDVEMGRLRAPARETVEQARLRWLEKAEAGEILKPGSAQRYKPSTLRGYADAIEDFIVPAVGRIQLDRLSRDDVQRFVDRLVGRVVPAPSSVTR